MQEFLSTWGYLGIIGLTFLEGETVVILAGIAAYQGYMDISLVMASAIAGTFCGDQLYYYIGRRYGTPLLERWPNMRKRVDWVFRILRKYETAFILSFRFLYGVRNVSPFVIGMSGVSRLRFGGLNLLAAMVWAAAFAFGGYYFGHALEKFLGEHQTDVLFGLGGLALVAGGLSWLRNRYKARKRRQEEQADMAETAETASANAEG
ncbi:DedA family protein [Telmatospirillum sp. J64-1]|uniref:DedA family protein n=1 Tax=Telmatospirillum sp. J64-1 TaxID=2502183 RepID=UPI00163DAF4F|nr:DedA family protein [Telmatospirillum sp. J64-1]